MTILMFLDDNDIIPRRYNQRGIAWVMFLLETIASLFVIEVAMILIWSKIELVVEFAVYQALDSQTYSSWGGTVANVLVLAFAAVNFFSMAYMTNKMDWIINQVTRWKTSIQELFTQRRQGHGQQEGAQICIPLQCQCVPMSQAQNGQFGIPQAHSTVNDQREQISAQQVRPTTSTGIRNGNQGEGDTQQARQRLVPRSSRI